MPKTAPSLALSTQPLPWSSDPRPPVHVGVAAVAVIVVVAVYGANNGSILIH